MPEYSLETGKLLIHNSKKSDSFIFSSLYSFRLQKEGVLIMLGEIKPNSEENEEILKLIFESFKNYFQNQKTDTTNLELYFEDALQKTNQELQIELIKKDRKDWLDKCSLILAVIKEGMIHFSYIGSDLDLFLVRNNKLNDILKDKLTNKINPFKIFSHIVSGNMEKDDYLLFSNATLLDYFSQEKIKKVILSYTPKKAVDYFKTLIGPELNPKNSLITLLIKIVAKKKEPVQITAQEEAEEETAASVPPPAIVETKNKINISEKLSFLKEKIIIFAGVSRNIFTKIINFIRSIDFKNLSSRLKVFWENLKTKTKNLSSRHKIILLSSLFLLLLFIQSLAFLGGKQLAKKQKTDMENVKKEIQIKQSGVEISLNYKNKDKAKKYLEEIALLISQLPSKTDEDKQLIETLKLKNQNQLNEIDGIFTAQVVSISNLSSLNQNFQIEKIFLADKNIYGVDFKNNAISQTNLENKNTSFYKIDSTELFNSADLLDKDNLLLSTKDGKLFKLSLTDKKLSPYKLESNKEKIVQDIKIYQGKLYLLDSKNNQIIKYQKGPEGFNQEKDWIKETFSPNEFKSSSLVINSSVYILKNNGQILKFYLGKKKDFQLSSANIKPVKIFADIETNYLYILDSSNKKVVVVDENGKTQKQLTNEKFSNAKDIFAIKKPSTPSNNKVIEGKENKIYLLTDTELLEATLE